MPDLLVIKQDTNLFLIVLGLITLIFSIKKNGFKLLWPYGWSLNKSNKKFLFNAVNEIFDKYLFAIILLFFLDIL